MKLNLGSHSKRVKGYKNVDIQQLENVDEVWDLTHTPYPWADVDDILMCEVLEHIGFRDTYRVLSECYRILKFNGTLHIQVPDIEKMMFYYINNEICDCVPRKANYDDYRADVSCPRCQGKALIHPERWHFAFVGAQKHPWDLHRNIFTPKMLMNMLGKIGFSSVKQKPNIYKIIINCKK